MKAGYNGVCVARMLFFLACINGVLVVEELWSALPEEMVPGCIGTLIVVLCMVGTVIFPQLSLHQYLDLFRRQKKIRNGDSKDEVAFFDLL